MKAKWLIFLSFFVCTTNGILYLRNILILFQLVLCFSYLGSNLNQYLVIKQVIIVKTVLFFVNILILLHWVDFLVI
jgi:hypothetical protein